jgi:hypothetical protein
VQQQAPEIPTVYLTLQQGSYPNIYLDKLSAWTAGFDPATHGGSVPRAVKAAGGAIWSPFFRDVDASSIEESHRLGLKVVVWTVNQPEDMAHLIDLNVDGIISDRPDVLRSVGQAIGWLREYLGQFPELREAPRPAVREYYRQGMRRVGPQVNKVNSSRFCRSFKLRQSVQ